MMLVRLPSSAVVVTTVASCLNPLGGKAGRGETAGEDQRPTADWDDRDSIRCLSKALVLLKHRVHMRRRVSSLTMVRVDRSRTGGVQEE